MSAFSQITTNPLNIEGNMKQVAQELINKEKQLLVAVQEMFVKGKQHQTHGLMLIDNNYKIELQLNSIRQSNERMIGAISQNTANSDELKQQIATHKHEISVERKDTRASLQSQIAHYARAMVDAQDKYTSINLNNDIQIYKNNICNVSSKINGIKNEIKALEEVFDAISPSQELAHVHNLVKKLKDEEESLIRKMTSKENADSNYLREIKKLKSEISQLQNK